MSKLEERIAATEQRLKALRTRQVRAATKQRARDARQKRQDDLRRKILLGGAVLELVERGEIEKPVLAKWLSTTLARAEDLALFADYLGRPGEPVSKVRSTPDSASGSMANRV